MSKETLLKLQDPDEKIKRLNLVLTPEYMDAKVEELEVDLLQYC